MIENESERLRYLMEQLLATAQLDRAAMRMSLEPTDLNALCRSVAESAAIRLPERVVLDTELPDEPINVIADRERLRQAVENLVDNAVKYSPDGGRIVVDVNRVDGTGRISVRDEGIGIPPGEQQRIFEKFYRLDPGMTRGVGGSGLGLYIIREVVTQMGGDVLVDSDLGRGSTFTISLPLR
jgi:signal transduction histidine kinase